MYDEHLYENVYYSKVPETTNKVPVHNPELLKKTKEQADEIVEILYENVNKVMERQDKLEDLNATAETLEKQATIFQKKAVDVKRKKRWEHMKTKIVIGIVNLIFLLIMIGSIVSAVMSGN